MTGVRDYSTTAASNLSVAGISLAEGMARASVNNAMRAQLADTANLLLDLGGATSTTGSANAYLLSLPSAPSAYSDNLFFLAKASFTNTAAATLNLNGIAAADFKKKAFGTTVALEAGDFPIGHVGVITYSSADTAFLLLNPATTYLAGSSLALFMTLAAAEAATIPASITMVETYAYATAGDGGGAVYVRMASEPAHGGKFQSADGDWWQLTNSVVKPEMYGAAGDGVTDDDVAMVGMADQARERGYLACLLTAGKIYTHQHVYFLSGIPYLFVDGNGASVRNLVGTAADPTYHANAEGLAFVSCFQANGSDDYAGINSDGELINTVAAGATSITVSDGSTNIAIGDRVLIYGFDGQGTPSFPPCPRFFEYHTVTGKAGAVLTLQDPLRYRYDAAYPENALGGTTYGAARVIGLNRTDFTEIKYLHLRNLHIASNPAWTTAAGTGGEQNGRMTVGGFKEALLENVSTAGGCYPGQGQSLRMVGCTIPLANTHAAVTEFDKCLETVVCESCSFGSLSGGNGTRTIHMHNCQTHGASTLNPFEELWVNGGNFFGASSMGGTPLWGLNGPVRRMYFDSARFNVTDAARTCLLYELPKPITIAGVTSTTFTMARAAYDSSGICTVLYEGCILYDSVGAPAFRLGNFPTESAGTVTFTGTLLKALANGDVLSGHYIHDAEVHGMHYDGPYGSQIRTLPLIVSSDLTPGKILDDQRGIGHCRFDNSDCLTDGGYHWFRPGGRIRPTRMIINVERAYSGATNPATLTLFQQGSAATATIDLRTAGVRTIKAGDVMGANGAGAFAGYVVPAPAISVGDTLTAFPSALFFSFIGMNTTAMVAGAAGTDAVWNVEIEGVRV